MDMQDYTQEERDYIAEIQKARRAIHDFIIQAWYTFLGFDFSVIEIESEEFKRTLGSEGFYGFVDGFRAGCEGKDLGYFLFEHRLGITAQPALRAGYETGRRFRGRYKIPALIKIVDLKDCKMEESEGVTVDAWVARDKDGEIYAYGNKPRRFSDVWVDSAKGGLLPPITSFLSSLTWESEAIEVSITIKPK